MSDVRFDGQVVVITGAGRGMGRHHAKALAARGAAVVINDLGTSIQGKGRDERPAFDVVAEIEADGGRALANTGDVSDSKACTDLIADAVDHFGRVDAVIHNAGIARCSSISDVDDDEWKMITGVTLNGAFWLSRAAWPHFEAQGGGRLLYISSAVGLYGGAMHVHYAAAKMGVNGLSASLALEGAPSNIRVNTLAVGAYTRMGEWGARGAPNLLKFWETNYKTELTTPAVGWLIHPESGVTGRMFQAFGPRLAEVLIAETRGLRKLDITMEDVRDSWSQVADEEQLEVMPSMDHFQAYLQDAVVEMGGEPYVGDAPVEGEPGSWAATVLK